MSLQNNSVDILLDQVIASITEEDIKKIIQQEASCLPGQPGGSTCPPPRPPLRMIAYDDMVNGTSN